MSDMATLPETRDDRTIPQDLWRFMILVTSDIIPYRFALGSHRSQSPDSDVYVGLDSVLQDFFGRLFAEFDEWVTEPTEFFEAGDRVFALGTYSARARATGKRFKARFAHLWTLRGGLIVRLQQCADTVQLHRALAD
jgi:ketosteroid isomerase-like protein